MKNIISLPKLGVLVAFASSLCCILPVFAFLTGVTGIASNFSWIEPIRPYCVGLTVIILGVAWFQKLKPQQTTCNCEENTSFLQSKLFLALVTVMVVLLLTFPSYSYIFFQEKQNQVVSSQLTDSQKVDFTISGMTCTGCEHHVNSEISKLKGIIKSSVSYEKGRAVVKFESKKTSIEEIEKAINTTGYKVVKIKTLLQ
ncbi:MAG: mercuric transport protein MerTP [Spirosomaceae bacterium]|jgi:copper chaperone CopZ|nr:mercuric transport protein MerTP [Spirosomataceae bacterium]